VPGTIATVVRLLATKLIARGVSATAIGDLMTPARFRSVEGELDDFLPAFRDADPRFDATVPAAAGGATIKINPTAAGKRLLKRAKRLKPTAKGTFTPTVGVPPPRGPRSSAPAVTALGRPRPRLGLVIYQRRPIEDHHPRREGSARGGVLVRRCNACA
jgi:hypothetical protein